MSASVLSLPVDIPWKRLCVSRDMIDTEICDRQFPLRWRSSLAVFSYEPPEEDQEYEGQVVSYLKVAATITGFQPDPEEVGLTNRRIDSYWNDPAVIENYKEVVAKYYGCYGAILEVAVAPTDVVGRARRAVGIDTAKYPYFADYEPKKRELYELVSETGETMSRSLDALNVRKGLTTTSGHEVLDVFSGANAQASFAGTGGGFGFQGQWGTRDMTQEEVSNIRTTDQARELRETFSHTTQLTQMYHQLSSYHLGTNRAVFFMLPRPHIVQSDLTFVNGPRLLEGVQEIFLVVMRPKEVEKICVEAYLETAHIVSEPIYKYAPNVGTVSLHVAKHAEDHSGTLGDDSSTTYAEDSATYVPPSGWEVDIARDGGFKIASVSGDRIVESKVTEVAADHVTIWGKVSAYFEDNSWPIADEGYDGVLDMVVTVYIRKIVPDVIGYDQNLWITGRGVCCCDRPPLQPEGLRPSVNWEDSLPVRVAGEIGGKARLTASEANDVREQVGRRLVESVNDPDRYEPGKVGFAETRFMGRIVSKLIRSDGHPDNVTVTRIKGLRRGISSKVARWAPKVSRGRLLQMPFAEMKDRFDLDEDEAIELRRAALGLEGEPPTGARRWEPPEKAIYPGPKPKPKPKSKSKRPARRRRPRGPAAG